MKSIRKIVFEDVIPEDEKEKKELDKIIEDVKKEKVDISKIKRIRQGETEEEALKNALRRF